jgi:hypothetical protein
MIPKSNRALSATGKFQGSTVKNPEPEKQFPFSNRWRYSSDSRPRRITFVVGAGDAVLAAASGVLAGEAGRE